MSDKSCQLLNLNHQKEGYSLDPKNDQMNMTKIGEHDRKIDNDEH